MADPLGPRHFADVHQAFDAVFQLDEGTVAHHVDHRTLDGGIDRVLLGDILPRTGRLLLEAQGDLFFVVVDVQDHALRTRRRS